MLDALGVAEAAEDTVVAEQTGFLFSRSSQPCPGACAGGQGLQVSSDNYVFQEGHGQDVAQVSYLLLGM